MYSSIGTTERLKVDESNNKSVEEGNLKKG